MPTKRVVMKQMPCPNCGKTINYTLKHPVTGWKMKVGKTYTLNCSNCGMPVPVKVEKDEPEARYL